jgi:hypothetical protein
VHDHAGALFVAPPVAPLLSLVDFHRSRGMPA